MASAKGSGFAPRASLAPIVVALLSVVSVSLLGFVVAWWPEEPAAAAPQRVDEAATAERQSFDGGSRFAPAPVKQPVMKWM
jgi:hypothetical protein